MDLVFVYYSKQEEDKQSGKFVQIRNKTMEYLVLGPKETALYHADLVERFCAERGLRGSRTADGKRFDIHEPQWVVVGGGKFEMERAGKRIRFYDDSMAYGRFDPKRLKEKILKTRALPDYTVDVE